MTRQIRLNAFDMNCVGHIQHGMWAHPRDQSAQYTDLEHWVSLARTLEAGLFDGLFLADILGVYDVFHDSPDPSIRNAVQIPVNDPLLLIPAMAYATQHLGFGVTCNLTYEPPYTFARRMSTLDHLTKGRIGWNVVTGYLDSAARGMGLAQQPEHDSRYDVAEEYMQVAYQLWEGSWEDAAVLRDRDNRIYADPSRIHRVKHEGRHYKVDALHLSEPSPQRTPVLYQAGASDRGRAFAAEHAECIFVNGQFRHNVRDIVTDIRARAKEFGRDPYDIKFFVGATVIVAPTEAEAQDKLTEYREYASSEGALAHYSASVGVDFSRYGADEPIRFVKTNALRSNLEAITVRSGGNEWTLRKLMNMMVLGSRQAPIVGSPSQVADQMQAWVDEADVDGFNLSRTVIPECVQDFISLVVPELQSRGIMKLCYEPGTLREKLYGPGRARLPSSHPATRYRR
ncbi:MAG TPA: LLM class flavin-dependent oxidoreductase [Acetobacteraceae bacterium]|jgi:FMN-dependent oxidoreductase (nitrilotriacetate monooxygenase family)|nr:LLM class flavin-dependent oxidoreductase [Acetobacteraceae bacterium]